MAESALHNRNAKAYISACIALALIGSVTPAVVIQSSATQQLQFYPTANGVQALANGTLTPNYFKMFHVLDNTCNSNDSFMMELWDLGEEASGWMIAPSGAQNQPFLVGNRGSPPNAIFNLTSNTYYFEPRSSATDLAGEGLNRPYLKIQDSFRAQDGSNSSDWYIMILNAQNGAPRPLTFQLRVSCTSVPLCPAPVWAGSSNATAPCSGKGNCMANTTVKSYRGVCDCSGDWGGTGCNQQVTQLSQGIPQLVTGVPGGEWRYFAINVPSDTGVLVAEMRRVRGDPILFLKGEFEGEEPGALPSALDFATYADAPSWRTRSDTAQILRTNLHPGDYYVGVLNNAEDIQEAANYTLTVRYSQQGPLCPWNCNGNGNCVSNGVCSCKNGFGGRFCDGPLTPLSFSNTASGMLQPGNWAYFRLDLTEREARTKPLTVKFDNSAGQSIVLASFRFFPTLLSNNFTFRAGQITGQMSQILQPNSLIPDDLNFGIYNMNFYVHSPFNFQLSVSQNKSSKADYTSWISVGAALGCSGLIVFLIYHGHRAVQRRRLGARGWEMWSWRSMPVVEPMSRRRRSVRRRGLDPTLVQSFPTYTHDADRLAKGLSQTPKSEQPSEDEKACSVCLGEYEDGDLIKQLLPCRHDFHCKCIDQWLSKNSTCPMCRILLTPPNQQGEGASEPEGAVGGGNPVEEEPATSRAQEIRIEMIEDPEGHGSSSVPVSRECSSLGGGSTTGATTLPSSQNSVAGSSVEGRLKTSNQGIPET